MIDINFVQHRLDTEVSDMCLPLRLWCWDLIGEIRKLDAMADNTTLVTKDLQDNVKFWEARAEDLEKRMSDAAEAFDEDNFVTGMCLLRPEVGDED